MKSRVVAWLLSSLLTATVSVPCFAQVRAKAETMTLAELRSRVADARAKDKRLIITLRTGGTISGTVSPVSDSSFQLTHSHGLFGEGDSVTVNYADVVSVKGRNPLVKVLKDIGAVSVMTVAAAAYIPLWVVAEGLSLLINGEPLPSCSTRN